MTEFPNNPIPPKGLHIQIPRPVGWGVMVSISTIVVLGMVLYGNTLNVPFVLDDFDNIVNNQAIRIKNLDLQSLQSVVNGSLLTKRSVANLSFAMNYYMDGLNVPGYHIVNIAIHILCGVCFFFLSYYTLLLSGELLKNNKTFDYESGRSNDKNRAVVIASLSAILWISHPIQTQSVTYIVQRMTSLASLFYVLSILSYIRVRLSEHYPNKIFWMILSVVSGIIAIKSKEIAATLPIVILLYEWFFFKGAKRLNKKNLIFFIFGGISFLLLGLILLNFDPVGAILHSYSRRSFSPYERVLTEFRVIFYYISLLLYPHPSRLNLDHDFLISRSPINPLTTFLCLLGIIGCLIWAIRMARTDRLLSFCILWFFINLAIESSIIGLEIIFEHRLYLPSMMFILAAVIVLFRIDTFAMKPIFRYLTIVTIILVSGAWTVTRNEIWKDPVVLWSDAVKKSPEKSRPYSNLGDALVRKGMTKKAIPVYQRALELDPNSYATENNLGVAWAMLGKYWNAEKQFQKALNINPDYIDAKNNLDKVKRQIR
jgi:tetratricopeptide (TPR) repeat protein